MRLLPTLTFTCFALTLWAQEPALRETFSQAKAAWATQGNREEATLRFENMVAALAPKALVLGAEERQMLCESYNWLAVLDDRAAATKPKVGSRLQALVALNPDFEPDRALTSQRLLALHERVRSEKYAPVRLSFEPAGGTLLVDGQPSPALARKFLPFGSHTLSYQRPGHTPNEQTVELAPRDAKTLAFNLTRIASSITLYTQPGGPEVLLDGRSLGQTRGQAGPEAAALAVAHGLRPEDLSEPFLIPELPPGKHRLELRGACFRPRVLELGEELGQPFADHTLEPIRMSPSRGTLALRSSWPGGELFLSGEARGPLPIAGLEVCSGTYDLLVRFPAGGYSQQITIEDGKALALEVEPRPRVAFLGLEGGEFTGKVRFQAQLDALGKRLQRLAFLPPLPGESPAKALSRLKASRGAELILTAVPVPDKIVHQVELTLTTLEGEAELARVKPLEEDPLGALADRLNRMPRLQRPGLGLTLLDLASETGPWVLAADEAARKAGIQPGLAITEVNGQAVTTSQALRQLLTSAKGSVTVKQADQSFTLPLRFEPLEVPVGRPTLSYPAVLAQLRLQYLGAKGEAANLLKLNIGLTLMHFQKYDKAIEILRDAHLGTSPGISQGTLDFHVGRCFLRLGSAYRTEAAEAFRQAMKYPQATLLGPDGPLVAPLAKQALEDLK